MSLSARMDGRRGYHVWRKGIASMSAANVVPPVPGQVCGEHTRLDNIRQIARRHRSLQNDGARAPTPRVYICECGRRWRYAADPKQVQTYASSSMGLLEAENLGSNGTWT